MTWKENIIVTIRLNILHMYLCMYILCTVNIYNLYIGKYFIQGLHVYFSPTFFIFGIWSTVLKQRVRKKMLKSKFNRAETFSCTQIQKYLCSRQSLYSPHISLCRRGKNWHKIFSEHWLMLNDERNTMFIQVNSIFNNMYKY